MSGDPGAAAGGGTAAVRLLDLPVQHYAWGSPTAVPSLLGIEPDGRPWAELWVGAHPQAPSRLSGTGTGLDELVSADPAGELGPAMAERFGRYPFLLKVLAAAEPLSLQVHPSAGQASAGHAREEAAGLPRDAPGRSYRDDWPKPELTCALTEFHALSGFRPLATSAPVLRVLDGGGGSPGQLLLTDLVHSLLDPPGDDAADPDDAGRLTAALRTLLSLSEQDGRAVVDAALAAAGSRGASRVADAGVQSDLALLARLAHAHPADPGVVVAMLLNHVVLAPGQALFTPAGVLHTYLSGTAVELMASSDNVLRGGLTPKHVDVPELLSVLAATPGPPGVVVGEQVSPVEWDYPAAVPYFRLSRIELAAGEATELARVAGPQLVLAVEGGAAVVDPAGSALALTPGTACSVRHQPGPVTLVAGDAGATLFRARVP